MTRDDIIRMAHEAGANYDEDIWLMFDNELERFATLVAAAERNKTHVILERGDVAWTRYKNRIERMQSDGWRQCAVGQSTTQHCGMLEDAVMAEREACARVCDELDRRWINQADKCAELIRARSK